MTLTNRTPAKIATRASGPGSPAAGAVEWNHFAAAFQFSGEVVGSFIVETVNQLLAVLFS